MIAVTITEWQAANVYIYYSVYFFQLHWESLYMGTLWRNLYYPTTTVEWFRNLFQYILPQYIPSENVFFFPSEIYVIEETAGFKPENFRWKYPEVISNHEQNYCILKLIICVANRAFDCLVCGCATHWTHCYVIPRSQNDAQNGPQMNPNRKWSPT